ncbi:hypothetical protein A9Z42_0050690 [Trichoderma parareesei]|uniref:SRR1-like domain-containing protein n=1 Tax=Trichoderma parareesei TaxID=858221 RepID=A0A2H2ZWZ3_TRIPA|nr:hypothetical protein A9Z42_0050690 [Trichoderma parareesei]
MADNNEGWIQVKHSRWADRVRSANREAANGPTLGAKPLAVDPDVVAELQKEFQAIQADLEAYFPEARLRKILADHILIFPNYVQDPVSKIVCFGIGCFDHPEGNWQAKRTSYCQLAALLVIADEVAESLGKEPFKIIFQEPAFNVNDVAFIESLGHTVVESPEGLEHMEPDTLFYGPHLYYDLYAEVLKGELPSIFVGSCADAWDLNTHLLPEDFPTMVAPLRKIFEEYKIFTFPEVEGGVAFHGTYICLRPPLAHQRAV